MSENIPQQVDEVLNPVEDRLGMYRGHLITELPKDLYIPPDALEVFLEHFEGPLDLLLYLIRRQNLDILDIPIVEITRQYMEYIATMTQVHFELVAEYLLMAAMLAEIKSRMLLPRPTAVVDEEDDPRAELVRRLLEYERYQKAAENLDKIERVGRDVFHANAELLVAPSSHTAIPEIEFQSLLRAFRDVMVRAQMFSHHHIRQEAMSVRQRMARVLEAVKTGEFIEFTTLFDVTEGRMGVVVTFLAILELIKESIIELVQSEAFAQIHIRARVNAQVADADATSELTALADEGESALEAGDPLPVQ